MNIEQNKILDECKDLDCEFLETAKQKGKELIVGKTGFIKANPYTSEEDYKMEKAKNGEIMYHYHLCCKNHNDFKAMINELEILQKERKVHLDRFGMSIDEAMALPADIREKSKKGDALWFDNQEDWNTLGMSSMMQPHLGDNMIGSPASYETVENALKAGVTTIGNVSQFFGYNYPEFTDVEARTQSTLKSIALMAENRDKGTLIHSNLDDGYGDTANDIGLLIGCALLEKYIVEDLMGAKIAHSYGDMFHSPMKRLVLLSALNQINNGDMVGSMIFTNKLGRQKDDIGLNVPHLSVSLLYDMAGQVIYKTGHAVTTMANQGLTSDTTAEEIIRTLEYAKELESYIPAVIDTLDIDKIDREAAKVCKRGKLFFEKVIDDFSKHIDIKNPYSVLLAMKKIGIGNLTAEFAGDDEDIIITDYQLY